MSWELSTIVVLAGVIVSLCKFVDVFDTCSVDSFQEAKARAVCVASACAGKPGNCLDVPSPSTNCFPLNQSQDFTTSGYSVEFVEKATLVVDRLDGVHSNGSVLCPDALTSVTNEDRDPVFIMKIDFVHLQSRPNLLRTSYWIVFGRGHIQLEFLPVCSRLLIQNISVALAGEDVSQDDFTPVNIHFVMPDEIHRPDVLTIDMTASPVYSKQEYCYPQASFHWSLTGSLQEFFSIVLQSFHMSCPCGPCGQQAPPCSLSGVYTPLLQPYQTFFNFTTYIHQQPRTMAEGNYECKLTAFLIDGLSDIRQCLSLDTWRQDIPLELSGFPPDVVRNISIIRNEFCFDVSWWEPTFTRAAVHYNVEVTEHVEGRVKTSNHTSQHTAMEFCCTLCKSYPRMQLTVRVQAENQYGRSAYSNATSTVVSFASGGLPHRRDGWAAVTTVILPLILVALIAFLLLRSRSHHRRKESIRLKLIASNHNFFHRNPPLPADRWTIPSNLFNPDSFRLLGEGAFSSVYFSTVQGPLSTPTNLQHFRSCMQHPLAVKICRDSATESEITAFENECFIYKYLSAQPCPYVIQLVGLQLQTAPPMIALELACCGSLLDLLHNSTIDDHETSVCSLNQYQGLCDGSLQSECSVKERIKQRNINDAGAIIRLKRSHLLKFVLQIARGMKFLISRGVLHRDVACRNYLVIGGTVKVTDFGLACLLEEQDWVSTDLPTDTKPLRWMAPEAYTSNQYSEASDIWSFGVSLWEIYTKGQFPHSSLSDADVLTAIQDGERLNCPQGCEKSMHQIMTQCWSEDRLDRPSFSSLTSTLEGFMCELYPYVLMTEQ